MSSDHKHFGMNGNLSSSYKSNKARELPRGSTKCWNMKIVIALFLLVNVGFGFTCVSTCLKDGRFGFYLRNEDSSRILSENCNVSKEKMASSACCIESRCGVPSTENLVLDLSENVARSSSREDTDSSYRGSPSTGHMSTPMVPSSSISSAHLYSKEDQLKVEEFFTNTLEQCCESVSLTFAKICFWIFVGLVIGYKARMINFKSNQDETSQLMPHPSQQPHQLQFSSRSTGNWRKKALTVFVLSGMIFSFWLFWYLNKDIMLRREETLANMCDERARMLTDQFNVSMNHVHSLAILVSTFHHGKQTSAIDQKTFEDYTERTNFERPLTSGVAYALRVRHYEREHIEQQFGWTIKKMETENQTIAQDYNPESFSNSPIQDEYAPVIFSQKSVSHIVSIDMMSGEEDRENILRARASGKGVLTSPFKLLKSNHLGVVLTFAVYNKELPTHATVEQRIDATVGYLGASYDVPSLVEKLLQQLASKQTILVNVYDITSKDTPIKMYGSDEVDTGLLHVSYLDFGDPTRKHEMHCRFKQKPSPPWQAVAFSGGVLVITFLLGYIFHAAINRIAEVERDYRHMTELMHRAEAADVAKSQFLATVSHEIRTPMNGVLGMLQMLMNTNLDASQLDYAQTAHASGTDLISLINQVLDQAKIESGRLELEDVPFDVRAVLDKVLAIFSGRTYEKGLEMAVYVSNQVPAVVIGDQERFAQIITNLVGNAIKFTHEKGHIFVSVHLADEVKLPFNIKDEVLRQSLNIVEYSSNDSYSSLSGFKVVDRWKSWENFQNLVETAEASGKVKLLVTVEDTGAGIPQEAQGRMFTPFMQADSSTSRKYGGTGIGLSISKRSVNLMGGEIGFVSELKVGSTFSFTVTFTKAEADSLSTKLDSSALDIRGLKALVIDEKSVRAEVTRYHLGRLGVSAVISSSVGSACSNFPCNSRTSVSEAEPFSLVLIDHEIWTNEEWRPFIDLIKSTRPNSPLNNKLKNPPKIFLLSARISPTDHNNLKSDGLLDDVITKPLRLNALASTFQEATGNRQNDTRHKQASLKTLLEGKRILVVDDNVVNRRVAEGALKRYGALVTCVEGGQYAVEFLQPPHKFDACFMDLQMPEIDGFEATRRIRNLEREYNERSKGENWHTPILAMTADVIQATNEKCMKSGMDDYVSKPFGEGQIYSAVSRFFENG